MLIKRQKIEIEKDILGKKMTIQDADRVGTNGCSRKNSQYHASPPGRFA